jgi:hypothetical protein
MRQVLKDFGFPERMPPFIAARDRNQAHSPQARN